MKLSNLLLDLYPINLPLDVEIEGISLDSRLVHPGNLFLAFPGTQLDGRKFIDDALQKGASTVLIEANKGEREHTITYAPAPILTIPDLKAKVGEIAARFYEYPAKKLQIIGITGTSGKTSCSHFIGSALQQNQISCGIIGTLGIGLYGEVRASSLTTPDAVTLQKTFAEFAQRGANAVSMEVSSHSLDQGRVNGVDFEVGVFTNLTRDHLDYHETMEAYGSAKKKLFQQTKYAVINADDPFGKTLINELKLTSRSENKIFSYSLNPDQSQTIPLTYTTDVRLDHSGIRAIVNSPWGKGELTTSLLGEFNLSNLLAVINALCLVNIPFEKALAAIAKFHSVPGRMQMLGGNNQPLVVVDYAHKPDAMEKVLIALRQHCTGKLYCVFGCGGDRDRGKRPIMASIAERYSDQVIITDDNPRHENPKQIVADILSGFLKPKNVLIEHDRSKAIHNAIQYAKTGDCILIAGKGAETYQQIGDIKLPFSDREKVLQVLAGDA